MAKPALEPTCRMSSTGSSETMPKATAPVESSTPNRLNMPDQTTAMLAGIERVLKDTPTRAVIFESPTNPVNKIADIEPDKWAIVDNKLYLNNGFIAQTLWSFDKPGNIVKGDRNWPLVPKLGNP